MRKLFLFLCAALMSVGMFAATVTWNSSTLSSINMKSGSFTEDGVTLTLLSGKITGMDSRWIGLSNDASFKFSTSLGNFTRIEITATIYGLGGSGWTETSPGAVWTGEANETTFGMYFRDVSQIVFTIEEPTVAVTGVTLNQNEAQMTVGGETLTLTATVNPNNATDQSVSWSTSDGNVATVENGVVTAVAAGTATITVTTTDGSFTATCAITVTAPEPEPQPTTVTWGATEFSSFGVDYLHDSRTVKGITVTVNAATNNFINVTEVGTLFNATIDNAFTFSTELGNITKIECTTIYTKGSLGDGWTIGANSATWEGNTNTLNFGNAGSMLVVSNIIFTIGDAEPEPEPAGDEITVTWNNPSGYGFEFTQDGVTLTCGEISSIDFYGPGTFTTDLGNFTKIEVTAYSSSINGDGWSGSTWTGNAASVSFSDNIYALTSIVFTIEPASTPEPEPEPQPVTDPITPYADPQDASVYYSTFYDSNFKYELPANVEAYVADLSGANLLLTKIAEAGEVIPADNAVILKSTVTPINLTPSDADAVTFTATNDLQGSDTQIATPANCYVLAGTDGVVGFYHYTAANLNAHKAYVVYSGSNQAPRRMPFIFDQATGVENVQGDHVQSTKVIENGVLYIIKNGVKYNAMGQEVK